MIIPRQEQAARTRYARYPIMNARHGTVNEKIDCWRRGAHEMASRSGDFGSQPYRSLGETPSIHIVAAADSVSIQDRRHMPRRQDSLSENSWIDGRIRACGIGQGKGGFEPP